MVSRKLLRDSTTAAGRFWFTRSGRDSCRGGRDEKAKEAKLLAEGSRCRSWLWISYSHPRRRPLGL